MGHRRGRGGAALGLLLWAGCVEHGEGATDAAEATGTSGGVATLTGATSGAVTDGAATDGAATGAPTSSTSSSTSSSSSSGEASTGEASTGEASATSTGEASSGSTGATTGEPSPSFLVDVWPIFTERCGCHLDADGAGKLKLAKDVAYANMIGKTSKQAPALALVEPGSAEQSYLWYKLNDTQDDVGGSGKKMPPGGKLPADERALIEAWIDGGAAP